MKIWHKTAAAGGQSRGDPWEVASAFFIQSIPSGVGAPTDIFFKPDGLKMYVIDVNSRAVREYSLSVAWDISTASYLQNFVVYEAASSVGGIFFKPDGTKMYVILRSPIYIAEYDLSTAWDVSTATLVHTFYVATQDSSPRNVFFKSDGLSMFMLGETYDRVYEYSLSTAWDVSTSSYVRMFSVAAQETSVGGLFFKPDGTKMYVCGSASDSVHEYNLSTPWLISSASYVNGFSVTAKEYVPLGLFFRADGEKMYITGWGNDNINEYNLG